MRDTISGTTENQRYYVACPDKYEIDGSGSSTGVIAISGKTYERDYIFVVKIVGEENAFYTYLPNQKLWAYNAGVEDAFWGISVSNETLPREEISAEYARELNQEMRDYVPGIAEIMLELAGGKTLPLSVAESG